MATNTVIKKKMDFFLVHIIITFLLMFGFGYLTPFGEITPIGMQLLGIFLGVIYAWTVTNSLIWPSVLGIIAVGLTGIMPMNAFLKECFGHELIILMIFIFVFVAVLEELGLVKFLSNWLMSRKIIFGRPWIFTFALLFGAFICGVLVNEFPAAIIFWGIFYNIAKRVGFKPHDKYVVLMVVGIAISAMNLAGAALPFKATAIFFLGAYRNLSGQAVNYGAYVAFAMILSIGALVVYVLMMRFIFRLDISVLKQIDDSFVDQETLKLSKRQKYGMVFLTLMMALLLMSDVLPRSWAFIAFLNILGKQGIMLGLIVLMYLVKVDGKAMIDFRTAARGISWDMVFMFAFIMPVSMLLVGDLTGIKPTIVAVLSPLLAGRSAVIFALFVLLTGAIITNFTNNAVLGIIYLGMMVPMGAAMGIEIFPILAVMLFTIQLAYMTPAGSAPAAMVFGQTEWLNAGDVYKVVPIVLTVLFIFYFAIGYPLALLLF